MKASVCGFRQEALVSLGLDLVDAEILRYFVDFQSTGRMKTEIIDGQVYHWLAYQKVIDDLPVLGIGNKNTMARRFEKLVTSGVMEKLIVKSAGNRTVFRINPEAFEPLIDGEGIYSKVERVSTQKSKGVSTQKSNDIPILGDTKELVILERDENQATKAVIATLNAETGRDFKVSKLADEKVSSLVHRGYTVADIESVIRWACATWGEKYRGYIQPSTLFNGKFDERLQQAILWKKKTDEPPRSRLVVYEEG